MFLSQMYFVKNVSRTACYSRTRDTHIICLTKQMLRGDGFLIHSQLCISGAEELNCWDKKRDKLALGLLN